MELTSHDRSIWGQISGGMSSLILHDQSSYVVSWSVDVFCLDALPILKLLKLFLWKNINFLVFVWKWGMSTKGQAACLFIWHDNDISANITTQGCPLLDKDESLTKQTTHGFLCSAVKDFFI